MAREFELPDVLADIPKDADRVATSAILVEDKVARGVRVVLNGKWAPDGAFIPDTINFKGEDLFYHAG